MYIAAQIAWEAHNRAERHVVTIWQGNQRFTMDGTPLDRGGAY